MTAVEQVWDTVRPAPKRDSYGRYLIGGKPHTRVTTFAETIDDRYNLERWKQRMTAIGLTVRQDLYAQVASIQPSDKATLNRLCDDAVEAAKGSAGANLGTALHRFTERIDMGETLNVPAPWNADVAAYQQTLEAAGVEILREYIEQVVVIDQLELAGTFDRIVRMPGYARPLIADLKTGATLDFSWSAIAIQLACYANASHLYDTAADRVAPMIDVDREHALVIHLPAGQAKCTLYDVDIAAGWEAARLCAGVRQWRKRKNLAKTFEAPQTVAASELAVNGLRARVQAIVDHSPEAGQMLARLWPASVPTFRVGGHTTDHLVLLDAVCSQVEQRFDVPFVSDPLLTLQRKAVNAMRSEGFSAEIVDGLRKSRTPEEFAQVAADLISGRAFLRFEDGMPVVEPISTTSKGDQE